jgi:hypothetical protein
MMIVLVGAHGGCRMAQDLSSIFVRIVMTDEPQQIYGGILNRLRCEEIVSLEP